MTSSNAHDTSPDSATGGMSRFLDNREKYLMFCTTTNEKAAVARHIGRELSHITPTAPALRIFDAGMGDATVLTNLMRQMHVDFPHVPWLVVAKEISLEDARLGMEKLADRFFEHPQMVVVITNMNYNEAPSLRPRSPKAFNALNWVDVPLTGATSFEFAEQLIGLQSTAAEGWQVDINPKTGNPAYRKPTVLVIYRADHSFILDQVKPQQGRIFRAAYDLVIASQPYRLRTPPERKVKLVIAPLARTLAPGGRMITVHAHGSDPGAELIQQLWPDLEPLKSTRQDVLEAAKQILTRPEDRNLVYEPYENARSLFDYHMHFMPAGGAGDSIGMSSTYCSFNAATYVAQIDDDQVREKYESGEWIKTTTDVVKRHGRLWFTNESFVISRSHEKTQAINAPSF